LWIGADENPNTTVTTGKEPSKTKSKRHAGNKPWMNDIIIGYESAVWLYVFLVKGEQWRE
jgi:hypothetical protein